jgi:hypothetical protein
VGTPLSVLNARLQSVTISNTASRLATTCSQPVIQLISCLQDSTLNCNPFALSGEIQDEYEFRVQCEASGNERGLVLLNDLPDRANTDSMVQYGAKVLSITVYLSTVNTLFVIDYSLPFISLLLVPFLFSLTVRSLITYIFVRFIRPKSVLEKLEQSNAVNQRRRRREKRHGGQITYAHILN